MKPGEEWGGPCSEPPDLEVRGTDHDLAVAVARHPGALVRFIPEGESDVARAVGLRTGDPQRGWAVPMDTLRLDDGRTAVNMVVLGTSPARITWRTRQFRVDSAGAPVLSIVLATGQFHAGQDFVPRGHPGDGWAELQLYRVPRQQRAAVRRRLATGTHLPHPAITQTRVRTFTLTTNNPVRVDIDKVRCDPVRTLSIQLHPNAYRLLL